MIDFSNTFNTLPTNESLAERKATKIRFLKKENEELKKYAGEVKSSLLSYKAIISELISDKSCAENNNRDETQSIISHRISDILLSEKKELEKRIRKARKDISEAQEKAIENEKMAEYWLKKEKNLIKNYECKINGCIALSIEKEKIIEKEVAKGNEMERNLHEFFKLKENEITNEDKHILLKRKIEGYCKIINQLNKKYKKVKSDCEILEVRNETLCGDYKTMRDLLKAKSSILIPRYSTQLTSFQNRKEFNFKHQNYEEKLIKEKKPTYEQELKNQLENLKSKLLVQQLKLQSVSDEISRQKVKQDELLRDQNLLQERKSSFTSQLAYDFDANKENQYPLSFTSKMNLESLQNQDIEGAINNQSIFYDIGEISI